MRLFSCLWLFAGLAACEDPASEPSAPDQEPTSDAEDSATPDSGDSAVDTGTTGTVDSGVPDVTYADVAPILSANCLRCHSDPPSGAPFSLASYEAASARADRIVARAVDGAPSFMPPGGSVLSPAEGDVLRAWADAGAPE